MNSLKCTLGVVICVIKNLFNTHLLLVNARYHQTKYPYIGCCPFHQWIFSADMVFDYLFFGLAGYPECLNGSLLALIVLSVLKVSCLGCLLM